MKTASGFGVNKMIIGICRRRVSSDTMDLVVRASLIGNSDQDLVEAVGHAETYLDEFCHINMTTQDDDGEPTPIIYNQRDGDGWFMDKIEPLRIADGLEDGYCFAIRSEGLEIPERDPVITLVVRDLNPMYGNANHRIHTVDHWREDMLLQLKFLENWKFIRPFGHLEGSWQLDEVFHTI